MSDATTPTPGPPLPLPPTFPPGVDPTKYRFREVEHLLKRSAYINAFSISIPERPDIPILLPGSTNPMAMIAIRVFEQPHRFRVVDVVDGRVGATNTVGNLHASLLTLQWTLIPDDFYALPTSDPPPTVLNPTQSQRFTMLDGMFVFDDAGKNRFHGFGAGRTWPVVEAGEQRLRLGACGNIMQGFGVFEGIQGSYVINGYIQPPTALFLQMVFRIVDPSGRLITESELKPLDPISPNPISGSTYLNFLGEPDPEHPVQQSFAPDGTMIGATVHELLRVVHLDFDMGRDNDGLRTRQSTGRIVARLKTTLRFNPFSAPGTPLSPISWQTSDTNITFVDSGGNEIGTVQANIDEGRAFQTELPGAPMTTFRLVGFGQVRGGTGQFAGADGLLSVNSGISVMPAALSNLYVLRLVDPDGRYAASLS
jgi:hypothetical protein